MWTSSSTFTMEVLNYGELNYGNTYHHHTFSPQHPKLEPNGLFTSSYYFLNIPLYLMH